MMIPSLIAKPLGKYFYSFLTYVDLNLIKKCISNMQFVPWQVDWISDFRIELEFASIKLRKPPNMMTS